MQAKRRFEELRGEGAAASGSQHESVLLIPGRESYEYAELQRIQSLERRAGYAERVHQPLWQLCRSLPEVLHHAPKIAQILGEEARRLDFTQALSLCAVFARDVGDALGGGGADALVGGLAESLGGGPARSPEAARAAFSALSYVLRYCATPLLAPAQQADGTAAAAGAPPAIQKHYASLLGSNSENARLLGARALAPLLRRMPRRDLLTHLRKVSKLVLSRTKSKQAEDVQDGWCRLLYEVCVGVQGRLHARAPGILAQLLGRLGDDGAPGGRRMCVFVVDALLDATRPGEEVEPLWRAVMQAVEVSETAEKLAAALGVVGIVLAYSSGRLLAPRGADDAVVPYKVAQRRARDLRDGVAKALEMTALDGETLSTALDFVVQLRALAATSTVLRANDVNPERCLRTLASKATTATDLRAVAEAAVSGETKHLDAEETKATAAALLGAALALGLETAEVLEVARAAASHVAASEDDDDELRGHFAAVIDGHVPKTLSEWSDDADEAKETAAVAALRTSASVASKGLVDDARRKALVEHCQTLVQRVDAVAFDDAAHVSARVLRAEALLTLGQLVGAGDGADVAARSIEPLVDAAKRRVALTCVETLACAAAALEGGGGRAQLLACRDALLDELLTATLSSGQKRMREVGLRLGTALYATGAAVDEDDDLGAASVYDALTTADARTAWALRVCTYVEELPVQLASERIYGRVLTTVAHVSAREACAEADDADGAKVYRGLTSRGAQVLTQFCLGLLLVKFEPLWAHAKKVLAALAQGQHAPIVWPRLMAHLRCACARSPADDAPDFARRPRRVRGAPAPKKDDGPTAASAAEVASELLDSDRAHAVAWDAALQCGVLSGSSAAKVGARGAVDLFLWFVRDVFFKSVDDVDQAEVLAALGDRTEPMEEKAPPRLGASSAYKRLETVLTVFAEARFPKSLPGGDRLQALYASLLAKPRGAVAKLALKCLAPYKLAYLAPYTARLDALLDDKSMRDTLVKLKVSRVAPVRGDSKSGGSIAAPDDVEMDADKDDSWALADAHRGPFLPLLLRLLFGRFRAKAGAAAGGRRKASTTNRRATILAFVAALEPAELSYFIYMMARPFVSDISELGDLKHEAAADRAVQNCRPSRIAGFVGLTRAIASRLGFKVEMHVPTLISIILAVVNKPVKPSDDAMVEDDAEPEAEHENDFDEEGTTQTAQSSKRERLSALRCLNELLEHFNSSAAIWAVEDLQGRLWRTLESRLGRLDDRAVADDTRSAAASLVATLCRHASLCDQLASPKCVAALCELAAAKHAESFDALSMLLLNRGDEHGTRLLEPHARKVAKALATAVGQKRHSARALQGLREVAKLSETVAAWQLDSDLASTLTDALVPRLLTCDDFELAAIQACIAALVRRVRRPLSHLDQCVSLLAPPRKTKAAAEFFRRPDCAARRTCVADVCANLMRVAAASQQGDDAAKPANAKLLLKAASLLEAIAAADPDSLDDSAIERASASYSDLSDESEWRVFVQEPNAAAPLVAFCASTMRASDASLRDAAAAALRCFVAAGDAAPGPGYDKVLADALVPHLVSGLALRDDATRRAHVSVMRKVVLAQRPGFFADLAVLCSEDDRNTDFFENVAHLQMHRRVKALRHIAVACGAGDSGGVDKASAAKVLLPLALQVLYDERTAVHEALHRDAAAAVGGISTRLPWSKYAALSKRLFAVIKNCDKPKSDTEKRAPQKQKRNQAIVSQKQEAGFVLALCSVLDGFPFDLNAEPVVQVAMQVDSAKGSKNKAKPSDDKVAQGVVEWLLPACRAAMTKPVRVAKSGARDEVLRPPIALAILRLVTTKLRDGDSRRTSETYALVVAVCAALRNRDASKRDQARQTLARICKFVGPAVVGSVVLAELKSALPTGYMLAVRSATLHSIVAALFDSHPPPSAFGDVVPPGAPETARDAVLAKTAAEAHRTAYDGAIPAIAALLADDLFGDAAAARDSHAANGHEAGSAAGVPEAKRLVTRTYESLELVAKTILYRPSYAAAGRAYASTHELLAPFFEKLGTASSRDDDRLAAQALRCRAALAKIALGFAVNESATACELVYHAVAMLSSTAEKRAEKLGRKQLATAAAVAASKLEGAEAAVEAPESTVVVVGGDDDVDDSSSDESDDDSIDAIAMDEEDEDDEKKKKKSKAGEVVSWQPSKQSVSLDAASARRRKLEVEQGHVKVLIGHLAPKLTGRGRGATSAQPRGAASCVADEARRFGILMLRHALKKQKLDALSKPENAEARTVAAPMLALLAKSYKKVMRDDELRLGIVAVAAALLSWRLPTTQRWASRLAAVALSAARKAATSVLGGGDALLASFKMLSALLERRQGGYVVTLADAQLKAVAATVRHALSEYSTADPAARSAVLALFLALVRRPVVCAEVYDSVDAVAEIHVVSLERHERRRCAAALLHFALHFPMGKKRRKHHLAQMLSGLDYRYEEGRAAALEALSHAFKVFAPALLEEHAEHFFVALALRLANEEAQPCVVLLNECLLTLLKRIGAQPYQLLLDRAVAWLDDAVKPDDGDVDVLKRRRLRLAAARLLEAFVRAKSDALQKQVSGLLDKLATLLRCTSDDDQEDGDAALACDAAVGAVGAFFDRATNAAEAALAHTAAESPTRGIPDLLLRLLLRHSGAARLRAAVFFGSYFTRRTELLSLRFSAKDSKAGPFEFLLEASATKVAADEDAENAETGMYEKVESATPLKALAKASCAHLDATDELFDAALATQATLNLIYIVSASHVNGDAELVAWTFDRVGSMACRRGDKRRRACLTWFAAAASEVSLGADVAKMHLHKVLAPVQRALDEAETSTEATETAALAQELLQHLDGVVGAQAVARASAHVSSQLAKKRRANKAKQAAAVIADPRQAAADKLDRNRAKRDTLKRKHAKHKEGESRVVKPKKPPTYAMDT